MPPDLGSDLLERVPGPATDTPPDATLDETRSTCCYCGVGCGVIIESAIGADGVRGITGVRGDPEHPANFGRLCSKGSTLALTASRSVARQVRARAPELRRQRNAARVVVSWSQALDHVAERFLAIRERYGPDAVAFYISGQLLTEDYYIFNKLAKALVGTNNIDTNSRLCMSSAVAGYKRSLGADSVPCSYEDLDHAATVFIVGANPAFAHPVLYQRLRQARQNNPNLCVIVADPRRTDTADEADLYLQIRPGSDVWLFHGMLKVLIEEGLTDSDFIARHTTGFEALRSLLASLCFEEICSACGLSREELVRAARAFARGPTLSLWCQGLNQSSSGTDKNTALINLHLACAQIGKIGAGPFSLTGQPNAMGGREVGGMANLLPAHRDLGSAADRAEIARFWGVPQIPEAPGKTAVEMFEALQQGTIRAVWIACTNPAHSLPDQKAVRDALAKAELVVVQDCFHDTATAPYADVFLPATTWGEKDGTVTNSDRTISRVNPAQPAFGQARHDWQIALDFAHRLEARLRPGLPTLFPYTGPESIWNEHRATTIGRDLDIGGLDYAILERRGPQQWPYPEGAATGTKRLYEDHRFATEDGRARFLAPEPRPPVDVLDTRYPVSLTSGRLRDQWHGMSRTGTLARSFAHVPSPVIEIGDADAAALGVVSGDLIQVTGRRAAQLLPAQVSASLQPGQVFVAMHWSDAYVSGRRRTQGTNGPNDFFPRAIDPYSKQPELKQASVKLLKADLPWQWIACAWLDADRVFSVQQALRRYFKAFSYAHCVPFGRERTGLEWRAADDYPPSPAIQAAIEELLGCHAESGMVSYTDPRRAQTRRVRLENQRVTAFTLSGDISAGVWLRRYLEGAEPVTVSKRRLLAPGKNPPADAPPTSRILCNCAGVNESSIASHIASSMAAYQAIDGATDGARGGALDSAASKASESASESASNETSASSRILPSDAEKGILESLRVELRCGAQCGSCVPELRRLVREALPA